MLDKNNLKISCCHNVSRVTRSTLSNYISNFTELLIDYLLKTGLSWLNISPHQWPGGEVESGGLGVGLYLIINDYLNKPILAHLYCWCSTLMKATMLSLQLMSQIIVIL